MANTYTWDCRIVDAYPTHTDANGVTESQVVYNVHWRVAGTDGTNETQVIGTQVLSTEDLSTFTAFESVAGKRLWDLNASKAYVHEDEDVTFLEDFKVRFYKKGWEDSYKPGATEKDIIESVVTAKSGKIDMQKNDFYTEGKTLVTNHEGDVLECEDLRYLASKKRIFTDSDFVLSRTNSTTKGKGLEATPDLSVIILKKSKVIVKEEVLTERCSFKLRVSVLSSSASNI